LGDSTPGLRTPRVKRHNGGAVFGLYLNQGPDQDDDNSDEADEEVHDNRQMESRIKMLADAKKAKEIEVTRSTNAREQKKAELSALTELLSKARVSERITRASLDSVSRQTVDSAQPDDNATHMNIGLNIVDKRARDPITKELILYSELQNMQSRQWCFPIMTLLAKYKKYTYDHFLKPIFEECEELRTVRLSEWKPFAMHEH
jgi:hypothetical protein